MANPRHKDRSRQSAEDTARRTSQQCALCEGIAFFHTILVDPVTARRFHLYRCISCDNQQWTSPSDEQGTGPSRHFQ
jgi:hypothetical protein